MFIHGPFQNPLSVKVTLVQDLSVFADHGGKRTASQLTGRLVQVCVELLQRGGGLGCRCAKRWPWKQQAKSDECFHMKNRSVSERQPGLSVVSKSLLRITISCELGHDQKIDGFEALLISSTFFR